jgi:hypothetical protein
MASASAAMNKKGLIETNTAHSQGCFAIGFADDCAYRRPLPASTASVPASSCSPRASRIVTTSAHLPRARSLRCSGGVMLSRSVARQSTCGGR